ncbi:MAG TPA: XRE family transcriptional regulator [Acetobacteraceae bacterium]|nr:XRE family transcriptional regulator [Acetobacteraceae bacterium]
MRALLVARVIGVLDERNLTVPAAHELTGVAAADFSWNLRRARLDRFTIDRLMTALAGLARGGGDRHGASASCQPGRAGARP